MTMSQAPVRGISDISELPVRQGLNPAEMVVERSSVFPPNWARA
jgi:hypothetical protein